MENEHDKPAIDRGGVQLTTHSGPDDLFRLLVANVRDYAIFMIDPDGRIATWNAGAERIKGYAADEIIGRHFSVFYPEADVSAGKCEYELESATRDGRFEDEDWRVRQDGTRFWANVVITAIRDRANTLVGFAKITRDLTERKRNEDERAARIAAEEANRATDDFLAMLSHELRNPLAAIVTALQLTKVGANRHPTRELQVIERQAQHLRHLVDDLLDVSRVKNGKLELQRQPLDLRDAIGQAIETASTLIEQKAHHFELQLPDYALPVSGDLPRLTQVLVNVLCNAAKYTPSGGHITLSVADTQDVVVVSVRDDGVGIDRELLPRIFDPFVQGVRGRDRSGGGLGLGLGLARSLVEANGGRIDAHSDGPGLGSTFTIRLPKTSAVVAAAPEAPSLAHLALPAEARRLLVVDDNDEARSLLAETLTELGHDVRSAADGPDALELLGGFHPDVAILDIGLPGMDGYELGARIRALVPAVRLVAVTGYGQPSDHAHSQRAGFDAHLVKPMDLQRLLAICAVPLPPA